VRWVRVGLLVLGAVVLIVFIATGDVRQGLQSLVRVDPGRLLLVAGLVIANLAVKALRWQMMVCHFAAARIRWLPAIAAVVAGVAAGSLSPARGVELAKPMLLRTSHGIGLAGSTAAVLVERLLDGASLAVLCGFALIVLPVGERSLLRIVVLATGILLVGGAIALVMPDRLARWSQRVLKRLPLSGRTSVLLQDAVDRLAAGLLVWRHGGRLTALLSLSVVAAFLEAVRVAVVFAALGVPLSVPQAMFAFGAANLVAIATLVPGGIGVTEASLAAIAAVLVPGGASRSAAAAAALVDRVASYYLLVAVGGILLLLAGTRKHAGGTGTT
jgi:uncharacterized protein (TIRG00374 family)